MKRHIGTVLIVLGLLIVAFPLVGRYIADQRQKAMLDAFYLEAGTLNSQATTDYSSLDTIFETTNTEAGQNELDAAVDAIGDDNLDGDEVTSDPSLGQAMTLSEQPDTIGVINIEKIDLRAPIAEGADLDTLRFAIGHMESTTNLGEIGNSVVAGHRSHSFGVYFNRLDELEIGDEIVVETSSKTITYVVYETLIVEPEDVSVLNNSSSYRVLTLVTCDPVYNPTHRLIVHAVDKTQMN